MLLYVLLGGMGIALLAFAPDRLVLGSAGLADRWGLSRVVVGLVVVGFGTSAPEMLVSGIAVAGGEPDIGVGNIVGSNVANLTLVLGVAALVCPLATPRGVVRAELPLLVAATVGFAFAVQGGVSTAEGVALGGAMVAVLVVLLRRSRVAGPGELGFGAEVGEFLEHEEAGGTRKLVVDTVIGIIGTVLGAQLLVTGAVGIADEVGLSGGFVGMTIVALGTSLPELVTAVAAARAGEHNLILGNLVGSNLFNSLAVGAVVGVIGNGSLDDASLTVSGVGLMLVATAAAILAIVIGREVGRRVGVGLLLIYVVGMPLLAG